MRLDVLLLCEPTWHEQLLFYDRNLPVPNGRMRGKSTGQYPVYLLFKLSFSWIVNTIMRGVLYPMNDFYASLSRLCQVTSNEKLNGVVF